MTPSLSRAYEAAAKALSDYWLQYDVEQAPICYMPEVEAAISAFLSSLAQDKEPMKLMPRTLTNTMFDAGWKLISHQSGWPNAYSAAWDAVSVEDE